MKERIDIINLEHTSRKFVGFILELHFYIIVEPFDNGDSFYLDKEINTFYC